MAIVFDSFPYDDRSMDEQEWKEMMQWIRGDGILSLLLPLSSTGDLYVASYSGMILQVYPGLAWIQGFYFTYTTDSGNYTLVISDNPSGDPRIDLVILRLDLVANSIVIAVLEGTPAPSPIAPLLTQDDIVWEIALASVDVASGATSIAPGDITDLRESSTQGGGASSAVTLSNAGIGNTLVVENLGPNLSIKGLVAGTNISITPTGDDLTIASTGVSNADICIVTRTTTQSISASTSVAIAWDADVYDPDAMHDPVTNNSRITITDNGIYMLSFNLTCTPEVCSFSFLKNGATTLMSNVYGSYINPVRFVQLVATDYIEVIATNNHSVDAGVIDFISGQKPVFQVVRVG